MLYSYPSAAGVKHMGLDAGEALEPGGQLRESDLFANLLIGAQQRKLY
jgi:hypothetical protein